MESIHIVLFLVMLTTALCVYNKLPENIPMHWNAAGQVDGYGSRNTIFILPSVYMMVYLLFLFLPTIDVFKENVKESYKNYFGIRLSMGLFFLILYLMILSTNFYEFDLTRILVITVCLLFVSIGYFIKDIKRNYFVGIRTPWALNDEKIWDETHRIGGKLFIYVGLLLALMNVVISGYVAFYITIISMITIAIYSSVYSYIIYRKRNKKNNGKIYKK